MLFSTTLHATFVSPVIVRRKICFSEMFIHDKHLRVHIKQMFFSEILNYSIKIHIKFQMTLRPVHLDRNQVSKMETFQFRNLYQILLLLSCLLWWHQTLGVSQSNRRNDNGRNTKRHYTESQDSESEEEDEPISPPQVLGMKGLAGAGITHQKKGQSLPKCLGQDMRMEKVIQVTRFCEAETGEGKNQTEQFGQSLCFTACMYKYMGLIGDDLMFTSNIDTVVVDMFPAIAHSMVKKALRSCAKQTVLPLSKSDNCTSFGPVKGCILRNVNNICNGDY